jgi:beta-glucosidase
MIAGHHAARAAIKAVRPDLPVGFSLRSPTIRRWAKARSATRCAANSTANGWRSRARDDFVAIQNYERILWGKDGRLPAPEGSVRNFRGAEVYAPRWRARCATRIR